MKVGIMAAGMISTEVGRLLEVVAHLMATLADLLVLATDSHPTWLLAVFTTLLAGVATGTAANFSMCVTRQLVLF